MNMMQKQM